MTEPFNPNSAEARARLVPDSQHVRERMQRQRRANTGPEVALRSRLHSRGYRFRLNYPVPGAPKRKIDIAFVSPRVAVFVDGCFWHRCPDHSRPVSNNGRWWDAKLATNVARDRDTDERLRSAGWAVLRCWEHEHVEDVASRVAALVDARAPESTGRVEVRRLEGPPQ